MFSYELSDLQLFLVKKFYIILPQFQIIKINLFNNFSFSEDFLCQMQQFQKFPAYLLVVSFHEIIEQLFLIKAVS